MASVALCQVTAAAKFNLLRVLAKFPDHGAMQIFAEGGGFCPVGQVFEFLRIELQVVEFLFKYHIDGFTFLGYFPLLCQDP